jgi:hypothetical protein
MPPFGKVFDVVATDEIPCNGDLHQDHKTSRGNHSAGVKATIEVVNESINHKLKNLNLPDKRSLPENQVIEAF